MVKQEETDRGYRGNEQNQKENSKCRGISKRNRNRKSFTDLVLPIHRD